MNEHGGFCNAFTSAEDTNYHFDVQSAHFEPALDRFAQFFVCPLISRDGVDREMNAVDSENSKNLNSDSWRSMQVMTRSFVPLPPSSSHASHSCAERC